MRAACQVLVGVKGPSFIYLPCCVPPSAQSEDKVRICGRPSVEHHVCDRHEHRIEMCAWHWDGFNNCGNRSSWKLDHALFEEFYPELKEAK